MSLHENRLGSEKGEVPCKVDFPKVFRQRINDLPLLSEFESDARSYEIQGIGTAKIIKRGYALVLTRDEFVDPTIMDVWVQDPQVNMVGVTFPHREVNTELRNYLEAQGHRQIYFDNSALIYADADNKLYLAVTSPENKRAQADADEHFALGWVRIMDRYGIDKIIGNIPETIFIKDSQTTTSVTRSIISDDLIGRTRVNDALRRVGEKYSMTNSQFMRFRILANTAFDASQPIRWDKLAEMVVSES